jgi:hypothetical protein
MNRINYKKLAKELKERVSTDSKTKLTANFGGVMANTGNSLAAKIMNGSVKEEGAELNLLDTIHSAKEFLNSLKSKKPVKDPNLERKLAYNQGREDTLKEIKKQFPQQAADDKILEDDKLYESIKSFNVMEKALEKNSDLSSHK